MKKPSLPKAPKVVLTNGKEYVGKDGLVDKTYKAKNFFWNPFKLFAKKEAEKKFGGNFRFVKIIDMQTVKLSDLDKAKIG